VAANRKSSGARIKIDSASAAITSGNPCVQEGFFGIALDTVVVGARLEIAIEGVWKILVPASTVKGDFLYVPGANGVLTEDADVTAELTRTGAATNSPVVKATTARDAAGYAEVLILAQGATKAALQV